ncbi:MAG: hypothetical protein M9964_06965 [Solirubrobacterales bacterium]|nr:hypothetical protein [Solirubrobacterales bacterium]
MSRCGGSRSISTCGSGRRGNLPQIRADLDDPRIEAAEAFGAPAMIHARASATTSPREAATQHGVSMLLFEGGESNC